MTEQFADLSSALGGLVELPVAGRTFTVPSPPALVGFRINRLQHAVLTPEKKRTPAQRKVIAEDRARDEEQDMRDYLGTAFDEMVEAGVDYATIKHAGLTAYCAIVYGPDAARAFWESPLGEAPASTEPDPEPSTTTPAETPQTGSPSTTTSRPKSKRGS